MVRTQIYLTDYERRTLAQLARDRGRPRSELIREALDAWLEAARIGRRAEALERAAGMWRDGGGLPDVEALRAEWERGVRP
jgi:Arc/MetJ-type ribon-helix-helix transcriptional regulator